jgi:hypothetical protein
LQSFAAALTEGAAAGQLYYFTYDQFIHRSIYSRSMEAEKLVFPWLCERELPWAGCKELLPIVLRINKVSA